MSSGMMETEAGGEQTQYEAEATDVKESGKSTGQLGDPADKTTEDPANTSERAEENAAKGEKNVENIRYGQTISEGGMGGMTQGMEGKTEQEGKENIDKAAVGQREVGGYGGDKDMDRTVGA
ncbi:hypothetical protein LTR37_017050 [Vermiconidia calcicola]|uniref:Uncharacterized protein n=1 Tax=Vermiconidia calcicola TaxID=1690605 RepID=A0ACC3MMP8_9PEZI|nr:hypothetical protein LTR37_017050 [Vermiconidia calcicola]